MTPKAVAGLLPAICLVLLLLVPACSGTPANKDAHEVVMLFDSQVSGDSFSLACLKGAEQAKAQFDITLSMLEAGSDAEAGQLLERLARTGSYDLIICIGASQTEAIRRMAVKFTKQKFALVDGDISDLNNVSSLLTRDNESSFLVGALAAMMSKSGQIGFVGGRDEPSIKRFLAGYRAGAQYINPDCRFSIDYAGTWLNDGKTKRLAIQQILAGADVLYGPAGAGSQGVIEAAREQGLYAIGVDADQSPLAPQTVLISAIKNVNIPVFQTIRSLSEGRFSGGLQASGLKEGAVDAKLNPAVEAITPAMVGAIEEIRLKLSNGEISGPGG